MKTVIIITLCVVAYLLIGFGVLVMRARTYDVDLEDTALALLLWPVIGLIYVFYYMIDRIRSNAQTLGEKLAKRIKK